MSVIPGNLLIIDQSVVHQQQQTADHNTMSVTWSHKTRTANLTYIQIYTKITEKESTHRSVQPQLCRSSSQHIPGNTHKHTHSYKEANQSTLNLLHTTRPVGDKGHWA